MSEREATQVSEIEKL